MLPFFFNESNKKKIAQVNNICTVGNILKQKVLIWVVVTLDLIDPSMGKIMKMITILSKRPYFEIWF